MWRYKLLLFSIFIPLTLYTLWQSARDFEFRYFLQRLAVLFRGEVKSNGIWIHAASVGEVNAVVPLILKIHEQHPDMPVTVTSNTITSASVINKLLPATIRHFYFPLDYHWALKRILNKIKPKAMFIVETEFWPNLYQTLAKQDIPIIIINGRISDKTFHAQAWLRSIYASILPLLTKVYARSETDMNRFIRMGQVPEKINVLGNIKFSAPALQQVEAMTLHRPYVLAASTRNDEELLIVKAWLKSEHENHLLVIVPRHPQRLSEILKQLKPLNISLAIRSRNDIVTATTDIYIADTMGELKQFINGSEFVLMGGSFVNKGGHNILEVAQQGKAVIFGPDMHSFVDEAELFLQHSAGIQCDITQLSDHFNLLLHDNKYKRTLEENAIALINLHKDIINRYYLVLLRYIL